ncbi:glycosyltransferase [Vibrio scophthalmi]|uniref:Glycosyltransferase subfamily 4-like N-terminal domain-containing protein n=1 Tax=Vibrio scophthalmi TaxID=45658 RepID=A0A1E3WJL5_9VIBR|nr:glycosyltransferase [Vibrio scophthalmi]ODS09948.1 hypothetical protein VSF3289_00186 [Vibrio scophthalmi]
MWNEFFDEFEFEFGSYMNVAYIVEGDLDIVNPSSIFKKVLRQSQVWTSLGNKVWIFSIRDGMCFHINDSNLFKYGYSYSDKCSPLSKLKVIFLNSKFLQEKFKFYSINIVYSRLLMYTPYLEMLFSRYPTIVEINSDDNVEYSGKSYSRFSRIYSRLFGQRLKEKVDAFVFVTNELKKSTLSILKNKPKSVVIGNGYDFVAPIKFITNSIERVKLVFAISPGQDWQGVDRLLDIAAKIPEFDFYIVGEDGINKDNVFFLGYVTGEKLKSIYLQSHIGVSTLALDRKSMTEACPLKSREYMYYGLPCFGNYIDTDFIVDEVDNRFLYMKLSDISDIDRSAAEIREFSDAWVSDSCYKNIVHSTARDVISDERKEIIRLKLFNDILASEK